MTSRHWTEDELVAHLYGVGPTDGHLEVCNECSSRVHAMEETRVASELSSARSIERASIFWRHSGAEFINKFPIHRAT